MIHYISGGARSGKSSYAEKLALEQSNNPLYIATARHWGGDFENRIKRHQTDRDERWTNVEEELHPSKIETSKRIVVIDCVTLWLTNLFTDYKQDIEKCLEHFKSEIDALATKDAQYLIISNELGMGVHAETEVGRKFTDLQGWANQYVAQKADEATLMISGIPVILK